MIILYHFPTLTTPPKEYHKAMDLPWRIIQPAGPAKPPPLTGQVKEKGLDLAETMAAEWMCTGPFMVRGLGGECDDDTTRYNRPMNGLNFGQFGVDRLDRLR